MSQPGVNRDCHWKSEWLYISAFQFWEGIRYLTLSSTRRVLNPEPRIQL